tara:strand:- start:143 stop:385 length:243 start_codon:yes stop_codon:yes gene_type:complete
MRGLRVRVRVEACLGYEIRIRCDGPAWARRWAMEYVLASECEVAMTGISGKVSLVAKVRNGLQAIAAVNVDIFLSAIVID